MITLRPSDARGHAQHGWLDSHHTFSFADYQDPRQMGFRALRVINEDRVTAGQGFGTHGHANMEILSVVLEGAIAHKDSTGTVETLEPGEVQRMTAGTGVRHSEFNPSAKDGLHFLQIWLMPDKEGLVPSYEQKDFPVAGRQNRLQRVASKQGRDGALTVNQDVELYRTELAAGARVELPLSTGRGAWVQVMKGSLTLNGKTLNEGDGAAVEGESKLVLEGVQPADALVFDLA